MFAGDVVEPQHCRRVGAGVAPVSSHASCSGRRGHAVHVVGGGDGGLCVEIGHPAGQVAGGEHVVVEVAVVLEMRQHFVLELRQGGEPRAHFALDVCGLVEAEQFLDGERAALGHGGRAAAVRGVARVVRRGQFGLYVHCRDRLGTAPDRDIRNQLGATVHDKGLPYMSTDRATMGSEEVRWSRLASKAEPLNLLPQYKKTRK